MTDGQRTGSTYDADVWQQRLNAHNQARTPEQRLSTALTSVYRAIGTILTRRATAVRREVDRQTKSPGLGRLLGAFFENPFAPDATTEARHERTAQIEDGFIQAEGIAGGKLLERDLKVPLERQSNFLYVDKNGDVIWIKRPNGEDAVVTRFQFGSENEPGILKIQSRQDPSGQEQPSSVLRTMPRLTEIEHMATYLTALCTRTDELYGASDYEVDGPRLAA